eukprot:2917179-Amphidinium_carterae.1
MELTPIGAPFQSAGYEPNLGTGPAVTQMLPPPLPPHAIQPLSGRGCPYGPTSRASVTPPIMGAPAIRDETMPPADRPENVAGITEL